MLKTLKFILGHPLNRRNRLAAIGRYIRWQAGSRILDAAIAVPFGERSKLLVRRGMTGATQNIYCGLQEFADMAFVMHLLRPSDHFIDVGANIGSYTILAAEAGADVSAFEPAPAAFAALQDNVRVNGRAEQVVLFNAGVGAAPGSVQMTVNLDTTNHVVADGEQADAITAPVVTLDDVIDRGPTAIKIDVEGFERWVIEGARKTLSHPNLLGVVMEVNGSGDRYGVSDEYVLGQMLELGFLPYAYAPLDRGLTPLAEASGRGNTLFVRDLAAAEVRLRTAEVRTINGVRF